MYSMFMFLNNLRNATYFSAPFPNNYCINYYYMYFKSPPPPTLEDAPWLLMRCTSTVV